MRYAYYTKRLIEKVSGSWTHHILHKALQTVLPWYNGKLLENGSDKAASCLFYLENCFKERDG